MKKEIPKIYEAKSFEQAIYERWEKSGAFKPDPDPKKPAYSIMMPPPNATGTLHLGHATMLALEDILIRWKRMAGFSTLWIPGTDHAAIATQSVVEKKLMAEGIKNPRQELGREALLEKIREFAEDSKSTIRNQIRRIGASCDWSRERYTFSEEMSESVNELFRLMLDDGLIYRGDRIVNWDPNMQTTVADDEIEWEEEKTPFYIFKYGPFEIGTARPETKFGDKYVVMHPDDKRYKKYKHGQVIENIDWIGEKKISATVIKDNAVDPEFGTGVMTITPWHDATDFEIAERHKLDKQQIIDLQGKLLAAAGELEGQSIEDARPKIVEKLKKKKLLVRTEENYLHRVALNYRGKGRIEPQILKQWFIDVNKPAVDWKGKKLSLKEVLQDAVNSEMIRIIPDRFNKTYFHWIDNLRDWCISRQIWWGHRIPVWHDGVQDEDTLDTWFSSALWTFSTLGWPKKTPELLRYHPSSVLETGYDILFFWVARMILASTYALRKSGFSEEESIPFKDVYLHGMIRDIHGKKMSKSNPETCIDPLDMIDKYGADAIRLSLIIGSTPGNDMRLYEEKIAGYRNFVNKIWNGARFVLLNLDDQSPDKIDPKKLSRSDKWILTRLNAVTEAVTSNLEKYQFSEAGLLIYDFFWGEYCDWYLEISKVRKNPAVLKTVLKTSLKLMHPFMPYVTEALWQELGEKVDLIQESWPISNPVWNFASESEEMQQVMDVVAGIRSLRAESGVDATKKIKAVLYAHEDLSLFIDKKDILTRLANLGELQIQETGEKIPQALTAFVGDLEIYLPMEGLIDQKAEKLRIQKEIKDIEAYLKALSGKLKNKAFLAKAPEAVVEKEKAKLAEATERLKKLERQFEQLGA